MGKGSDGPDCLLVCTGSDCRDGRGYDRLIEQAEDLPQAYALPCQGLCHGPIAGVRIDGQVRWYEKVRTAKVRTQLVRALRDGERPSGLKDLEVRSRRGVIKARRKAEPLGRRSRRNALA